MMLATRCLRAPKEPTQCKNCQRFSHTKCNCGDPTCLEWEMYHVTGAEKLPRKLQTILLATANGRKIESTLLSDVMANPRFRGPEPSLAEWRQVSKCGGLVKSTFKELQHKDCIKGKEDRRF